MKKAIAKLPKLDVVPSAFLPGTQIRHAWDSTTLGALKTCPRLYQYQYIEGWTSKDESIHLRFGIEYHQALQDYDDAKAKGDDHDKATAYAIERLLVRTHGWEVDTSERPGDLKNRKSLVMAVVWYLDKYKVDAASTFILDNGKPATELSFKFELGWGPKAAEHIGMPLRDGYTQPYLLCGHLDRVVTYNDELFVMDRKAQPLSTMVLGQHGWIEIRNLSVGDLIAGRDGKFHLIKGLYPKGKTKVYRIEFNDKSSVLCAEDHLWTVATNISDKERTITTTQLTDKPYYVKFKVPLCAPIQHPRANLPVHPYIVGALLGDGYLNGSSVVLSTTHEWLIGNIRECLINDTIKKTTGDNNDWIITGGETLRGLREVDLTKKLARTKFIPDEYKFADEQQRRELLRGLMDTDGGWNEGSRIYDSMSEELINDICDLVRSLGGTGRYRGRSDGCFRASLRMPEWPTGIGNRYIKDVVQVENDETMCIETDASDGLYITENYTVTHNTTTTTLSNYYASQFEPNNQMSLYSFASKVVLDSPIKGVIIDAVQLLKDSAAFQRFITYRTPAQIEEWIGDLQYHLTMAEGYASASYWPMNDTACDKFGGCRFRKICSKDPGVRKQFLKTYFTQLPEIDRWNPLKPR